MSIAPATRPRLTLANALKLIKPAPGPGEVVVGAIRGYYHDDHGENKRGIYDDCIFIVGPEHFSAYNANVDASAFRDGIANLKNGTWQYKPGIHGLSKPKARQYQAFVQAGKVTVARDARGDDTGWFGINIHRGGTNTTSSLGCQTIPPDQWEAFRGTVMDQLKRAGQKSFRYVLGQ